MISVDWRIVPLNQDRTSVVGEVLWNGRPLPSTARNTHPHAIARIVIAGHDWAAWQQQLQRLIQTVAANVKVAQAARGFLEIRAT